MKIQHAPRLSMGLLEVIGGTIAQGEGQGPDKAHAGPDTAGAKVTDDLLAKIEAATRETLGEAAERFIPKETNEDGIELGGYAGRSEQIFHLTRVIATKALEAGLTDRATLEWVVHEVGSHLPVVHAWTDAGGSKWERDTARLPTIRNAVTEALKGWTGAKAGGGEGQDWPEPEEISVKLPPVSPFDVEQHLPPCLADYVRDQAELMGTPPETIAAPLVVALGAALGNRVGIRPKRHDSSWMTGGNLWGYTCASPGRMKSETVARGLAPLKALEKALSARHKAKRDQYEVDKVRYEVELAEFKKAVKSGAGSVVVPQPPEEPKPERLIAVDATVAKLGEICAASPHGVLIERDEITGLLSQLGAVGHEGDREFYLTSWNGETNFKVDRVGRGSLDIPRLTLSMYGGIQQGKLNDYVRQTTKGGAGADGLLARFQVATCPDYDQTFRNVDRPPDLAAQGRAFNAARHLFEIDPTAIGAKAIPGTERHYLQFTNEAQDLFDKWRERLENGLRKGDLHPALESHYAKYRSLIPKLALIFHLVEDGTGPVTIDALTMSIRWGTFLKAHARRIYAGALHGADLATKALADKVKAGKVPNPFRARDVYRAGWAGLSDKSDVEPAIDGLLDAGWIREEVIKGAGRATVRYWINPKIRPTGT
jgi:putative DNA primase/helicase